MAIRPFLAMTAPEIQKNPQLPKKIGWMACHFSPYGTGLSNLPEQLPEHSLLILNDRIPIHNHDSDRILRQLTELMSRLHCFGLLLDFQRPNCPETANLVRILSGRLEWPVAVSALYGAYSEKAVLLPPLPHHIPLAEHLNPLKGRELWLEIAMDQTMLTVSDAGAKFSTPSPFLKRENGHSENTLHIHYQIEVCQDRAEFTLWRTYDDLKELLSEAETFGIRHAVGLFQELPFSL